MRHCLTPALIVLLVSVSPAAEAVSSNFQCKVAEDRVIEVFSLRSPDAPELIDVRLNRQLSRPFEEAAGFEECSRGSELPSGARRGFGQVRFRIGTEEYSLEQSGRVLRNESSGRSFRCSSVSVYDSYCFCQHAVRQGIPTSCGAGGTHFNREAMLAAPVRETVPGAFQRVD